MDKATDQSCTVALLLTIAVMVMIPVGAIANGLALSTLWGWFIIPAFGAPALSIVTAIGLAMVVSYMTYQYNETQQAGNTTTALIKAIIMTILRPAMALGVGYIVHLFM